MNPDNFDKILLSEKQIEPSQKFVDNIMVRVQVEALNRHHKPFPWIHFAVSMLVLTILSIWLFPSHSVLHGMNFFSNFIADCFIAPHSISSLQNAILAASASISGSLLLIWLSLRLAGAER